ncbi:recombinase family protein [bacterium]|nr:recombinase family protein [bacterium]
MNSSLKNLIQYSIRNRQKVSVIIVWKLDRLARNTEDHFGLGKLFGNLGIRILSATETNENNSTGKLMRNIFRSFSEYENDIKRERTIMGMKNAINNSGRWLWKPPIGYIDQLGNLENQF